MPLPAARQRSSRHPLCRPAGWIALWRRIGNLSVQNGKARLAP
ncbi:hypothetical protein [Fuscovulum ytuae]|uniref:Uncharacterized protein n=1 Tax=Fuscovulum ytuae TaxID=3042299 RepID=A0ABY8QB15_9RHOB|nr:hypothetical protein [Fuscovulum sp. YMD61]WGV17432.1 hypothetical protein QF092_06475 [Fuscovulum sp. YMD61]